MFGRNNNTFPTPYTNPPNNGTIFNSNAFQQTNMFNFQFQNQTFNYSYNQPQQNLPNQFPLYNTNQPTNVNQPQNFTEFEKLLQESQQYSDNSLAKTSKNTYDKALHVYETVMNILSTNPYPITLEKLKVFITYQARNNIAINTLKSYITGFSYYFKTNNLQNLTLSNEFKQFKAGLLRSFKENSSPFAKKPFKPEFFIHFLQIADMNEIRNLRMMFYMTLSFYAFLRISELLNLRKKDIKYDVNKNKLIINIRFSKTDQNGKGVTTYLYNNTQKVYHPLNFINFISNLNDDDYIVNMSEENLRKELNNVLKQLNLDVNQYSWHSFRRGGATLASQNHIDPAIIKAHGRWQSEAYLLYVDRDQDNAGLQISDIL